MEKQRCFVYARLHDPRIQTEITGSPWHTPEGNTVIGYKKIWETFKGQELPFIIPHAPSVVHGFVYELTPEEIEKVDAFLKEPYTRKKHPLKSDEEVWIWFRNDQAFEELETK